MHINRSEMSTRIPIPRRGTKYMTRAKSRSKTGVSVVTAIRDMIGLARTAREVRLLVHNKAIKVNGRLVRDMRESVALFGILEANKKYILTLLPTGKYVFEETSAKTRFVKIIGRKLVNDGKIQTNLHDGTNIILKDKAEMGDSVELDSENKPIKIIGIKKGAKLIIISGRNAGLHGTCESSEGNKVKIKTKDKEIQLDRRQVMAI